MSAHTPGPWRVDTGQMAGCGPTSRYLYVSANGTTVCAFNTDHPRPKHYADARLIAAAPELLAACQRVQRAIYWAETADRLSQDEIDAILVDAIAKATGGAQ